MRSKIKSKSHIIECKSLEIIKNLLPEYWTIREYKPDYGLDLSVEIFETTKDKAGDTCFETLGEHFFIQVKGTEKVVKTVKRIKSEYNVEKKTLYQEHDYEYKEIEVIKFQIETSELYTIERMSASIPVMLFIVDITESKIYFLCLNDYIDKVLTPHEPNYMDKDSKVIYIPTSNVIDTKGIEILKFYAKRPKLYSFFIKAEYQRNEMKYINDERLKDIYPYFIDRLLRYDVWSLKDTWPLMNMYYEKLLMLRDKGILPECCNIKKEDYNLNEEGLETNHSLQEFTLQECLLFMSIRTLWDGLVAIAHVYEEDCREWFIPTYYNIIVSE